MAERDTVEVDIVEPLLGGGMEVHVRIGAEVLQQIERADRGVAALLVAAAATRQMVLDGNPDIHPKGLDGLIAGLLFRAQ